MRAVYPLVLALLSSISSPAFAQESDTTPATHTLYIDTEGRYTLEGAAISRGELRARALSSPADSWQLIADPDTPRLHISSVEEMLRRAGSTVSSTTGSVPPPTPPPLNATSAPPSDAMGPVSPYMNLISPPIPQQPVVAVPALAGRVHPLSDVRLGLQMSNLGGLDGPAQAAFGFTRAALGARAEISPWFQTQALLNVVSLQGTTTQVVTLEDGSQGSVELPQAAEGFGIRPRDLWADLRLDGEGRFHIRAGIQAPIFGVQPWFNDDTSGFYTDAVRFQSVAVLSGLQQVRAVGVSGAARLSERLTLSVMASNNDNFLVAEDNTGKDLSGRLELQQGPVTGVLSARYAPRGAENTGAVTSLSAAARLDTTYLRLMAEGLYGLRDDTLDDAVAAVPFVGAQGAAAVQIPAAPPALDAYRLVGRLGFFDPQAETDDADAWLQFNGGARVALAPQLSGAQAQVGLGYEVDVPINLELAVVHRALLEVLWRY